MHYYCSALSSRLQEQMTSKERLELEKIVFDSLKILIAVVYKLMYKIDRTKQVTAPSEFDRYVYVLL